ncbi:uncharacterized protein LOC128777072 isoform X1 [Panthera pardus]|uniref:Uncharacterized protein LOC128777072 isoform X1 n=1 Tax=Panthera pardus TaxID=9691 RepID=A0A9W2VIE3_PANPR|nr:uncharacterized protein LOC128777072 isoform X1 [Panthera pardus]
MRKRTTETVSTTGGRKAEAAARLFPPGPRAPSVTRSLHLRTQSPRQSPARHRLRPRLHAERTGARAPPQAPGVWPTQAGPAPRFSQHLHTQLQRCRTDQHSGPPTDIWSHNCEQQRKRTEAKDKILKKPREQPKVQREGGRAHPGCWVMGRGRPGDREDLVCLGPHVEGTGQPHRAAPDGRPEWRPGGARATRRWLPPSHVCRGPGAGPKPTDAQDTEQPLVRLTFRRSVWAAGAVEKHGAAVGALPGQVQSAWERAQGGQRRQGPACAHRFPWTRLGSPRTVPSREGAVGQLALCESVTYCYFHRDSRMTERKGRPRRRQKTGLGPGERAAKGPGRPCGAPGWGEAAATEASTGTREHDRAAQDFQERTPASRATCWTAE